MDTLLHHALMYTLIWIEKDFDRSRIYPPSSSANVSNFTSILQNNKKPSLSESQPSIRISAGRAPPLASSTGPIAWFRARWSDGATARLSLRGHPRKSSRSSCPLEPPIVGKIANCGRCSRFLRSSPGKCATAAPGHQGNRWKWSMDNPFDFMCVCAFCSREKNFC